MRPAHFLLKWFATEHLRDSEVKEVVLEFSELAVNIDRAIPNGAEKTTALRKLIEAKDAACRAVIEGRE